MTRYWIAVASHEHVKKGVDGGFAQVCHGKKGPLAIMKKDDWIIYYSPTIYFRIKDPCQAFTAIGRVDSGEPYQVAMHDDFIPWRRNISFLPSKDIPIRPLLDNLSFILDKKKWGLPFKRGCFEIPKQDFTLIAKEMGVIYE